LPLTLGAVYSPEVKRETFSEKHWATASIFSLVVSATGVVTYMGHSLWVRDYTSATAYRACPKGAAVKMDGAYNYPIPEFVRAYIGRQVSASFGRGVV